MDCESATPGVCHRSYEVWSPGRMSGEWSPSSLIPTRGRPMIPSRPGDVRPRPVALTPPRVATTLSVRVLRVARPAAPFTCRRGVVRLPARRAARDPLQQHGPLALVLRERDGALELRPRVGDPAQLLEQVAAYRREQVV